METGRTKKRDRRSQEEIWLANHLRRAADAVSVALSHLDEVIVEMARPQSTAPEAACLQAVHLMADARNLREHLVALSPLPIADED